MISSQITINKNSLSLILLILAILTPSTSLADDSLNVTSNPTTLVTIGDPGNSPDNQGIGSVNKTYQIGKYEVTAAQYAAFLNAVAWKEDPHALYHLEMGNDQKVACITRSTNTDGSYSYEVISERENLPITYVSLNDAERYCNWLENASPTSNQEYAVLQLSTEMGAYNFSEDANGNEIVEANTNALVHIPSQNEWVKAAYYNGHASNAEYSLYPTRNNTAPMLFTDATTATQRANEANYGNENSVRLPVITPVNCFSNTITSYQACDMAGNVAEWTTTSLTSNDAKNLSPLVITRGGSWKSAYSWWGSNELMRTAPPKGYNPSVGTNFIGFRIAVDLPPASFVENGTTTNDGTNDSGSVKTKKNEPLIRLTASEKDFLIGLCLFWMAAIGTTLIMITFEITMDYFVLGMAWSAICSTFPATRIAMIPIHILFGGLITDSFLGLLKKYLGPLLLKN